MGKKSCSWLIFLLLFGSYSYAELNHYVIYFNDKEGSSYSIERPEEFLSQKAIDRRKKYDIAVDLSDLPVNHSYIDDVKGQGAKILFATKWFNAVLVEVDNGLLENIENLGFVSSIEFVAPSSEILRSRMNLGKSGKKDQLSLEDIAYTNDVQNVMLGVDYMHSLGFKGDGVTIAVFDSGFDSVNSSIYFSHLIENDAIVAKRNFVLKSEDVFGYDSHGTKVLSTIAAYLEGDYAGTAYNSDIVLCVTEDVKSEYTIEEYNWLFAAEYADSLGVDIINTSLGYNKFDDPDMNYTYDDLNGNTSIISRSAKYASIKGMLVVSSAGNEGNSVWGHINPPSDVEEVLSVGSVDNEGVRSYFSSYGPTADGRIKPDVCAMGSSTSVINKMGITTSNGTSFSSPQIAGLAAGFMQAFPDKAPWEIKDMIMQSGSQKNGPDTLVGYGVPSFTYAYLANKSEDIDFESDFVVYPNPVDGCSVFVVPGLDNWSGEIFMEFYSSDGKKVKRHYLSNNIGSQPIVIDVTDLDPGNYIMVSKGRSLTKITKLIVL